MLGTAGLNKKTGLGVLGVCFKSYASNPLPRAYNYELQNPTPRTASRNGDSMSKFLKTSQTGVGGGISWDWHLNVLSSPCQQTNVEAHLGHFVLRVFGLGFSGFGFLRPSGL